MNQHTATHWLRAVQVSCCLGNLNKYTLQSGLGMLDHIKQGRELSTISYLIISGGVYATTTQRYMS